MLRALGPQKRNVDLIEICFTYQTDFIVFVVLQPRNGLSI
jgi:hypothetical protein